MTSSNVLAIISDIQEEAYMLLINTQLNTQCTSMKTMANFLKSYFLLTIINVLSNTALAHYQLKEGETGKYRWYDEGSKQYRPCCYCPTEATLYDKYIRAFQVPHDYKDKCEGSVDKVVIKNQTVRKHPYCFCVEKFDLHSEFIGCTLPNNTDVLWNCDNGFVYPNVSVYTVCQPQCKDDKKAVSQYDNLHFRCSESKIWEQNPADVHCKYDDLADENSVYVVVIAAVVVLIFAFIVLVLIIVCRTVIVHRTDCFKLQKPETTLSEIILINNKNTSNTGTSETSFSESPSSRNSNQTRSSCGSFSTGEENGCGDCPRYNPDLSTFCQETEVHPRGGKNQSDSLQQASIDEKEQEPAEEDPLLEERKDDLVSVKCCKDKHVTGGKTQFSVLSGSKVVIATQRVTEKSDFKINRLYDEQQMNHFIINNVSCAHGGKYEWRLKDRGKGKTFIGIFYLNVEEDRHAPQGESLPSLQQSSLEMDSVDTIAEELQTVSGNVSYDNKAIVCNRPKDTFIYSRTTSTSSSVFGDDISSGKAAQDYMIDNCKNCEFLLSSCIEDRNCFKYLETICRMLDPPRENIAKCWEGLAMFYSKELNIDQSIIDSIKYHKKGNPNDGHMHYFLLQILPPHGFKIGHIVYYFSRDNSFRKDVLNEIRKFHKRCQFCDKYLHSVEKYSNK